MSGCISDECLCFQFSFSFSAPLSLQPALKDKWWLTRWRTSMPTNVAFVASRLPRPFHFLHPASSHVIPQASNPGATLCRNTATRSPCSTRSSHRVTDRPHARLGHHVYAHDFFADAVHAHCRLAQRNARAAGRRWIMCAESRVCICVRMNAHGFHSVTTKASAPFGLSGRTSLVNLPRSIYLRERIIHHVCLTVGFSAGVT